VCQDALAAGIAEARLGNRIGDISHAVQTIVEGAGFSVVRSLVGHGVGRYYHEAPHVPNFGRPGRGERLSEGMTIAIEPMITVGSPDVYVPRRRLVDLDRGRVAGGATSSTRSRLPTPGPGFSPPGSESPSERASLLQ
jgi:methionine aminopeptidase